MTHSNPLIQKWEEIYGKKEEPKVIKAENEEVKLEIPPEWLGQNTSVAQVENAKNGFELDPNFLEKLAKLNPITSVTSNITSPSVATSNTGITKASNFLTHDIHDTEKTFLQVADKIKLGKAKVSSMNMEMDMMSGTKITFEVMLYEP